MDGYHVIDPQEHVNDVDPNSGRVVPGYRVTAQDHVTGTKVRVFVPDSHYSADNVRDLLEQKLGHVRDVSMIGTPPPAPST